MLTIPSPLLSTSVIISFQCFSSTVTPLTTFAYSWWSVYPSPLISNILNAWSIFFLLYSMSLFILVTRNSLKYISPELFESTFLYISSSFYSISILVQRLPAVLKYPCINSLLFSIPFPFLSNYLKTLVNFSMSLSSAIWVLWRL